ncbi:hypothetical protein EYR36_001829 [Pleurotus pulmonarius]|nr:hypothetical protein EYR36_008230 [Pleurotus pulmonarius]KAF4580009.1 hypothetical protein EYR36_001829 [Pleurotus pulmonarius]
MGVMERPPDDDWEGMIREWSRRAPSILKDLIKSKRMRASRPSHEGVRDQIAILGQYAVLSHCWDQDPSEELTFDDVPNLSDPVVNAKRGFSKLMGFAGVVKSHFGCRYLWMDTACISEADRVASIPLMFGWYRSAYVCVIYLSSSKVPGDRCFHEYRNDVFPSYDRAISFSSDGVMRIMVYLCKPCAPAPPSQVFAVIAQDPWSRGYTGIILEELPEKLYRRIGYKDYWYHEIKVERAPEWIYVK